ncbi:phage uncharacterized protein TIGR01671 [Thermoanaerobacter sp. YS13]|uniref:YopX family protein n=1 Tax=Thermoanaerobacter sp. YS13 TaxID=1511746 RepID=UPI0005754ADC|nr:YopX family protein [Thermoanaerobacter sp. YS13]KHO63375.1 phage uncharacterized protein TIGR01671 [Thermoanaerobacter sp. YS13]
MREIKFRAWHKERKEMYYQDKPIQADFIFMGNTLAVDCKQIKEFIPYEKVVLMQYTGLKDKNNKEIYEGDIVRYFDGMTGGIYFDEEFAAFRIEWLKCDKYSNIEEIIAKNCEVVGNIFQNPELLEEE